MTTNETFKMFEKMINRYELRQMSLVKLFFALRRLFKSMGILFMLFLFCNVSFAQRFAIISDYGNDSPEERQVADMIRSAGVEFIITAGDNFHATQKHLDTLIGKYYRWAFPNFFPVIGNHDITDPVDYYLRRETYATNYRDYFYWLPSSPAGRRYYSFQKSEVRFMMYNSDFGGNYSYCPGKNTMWEQNGIDSASIQGQWLKGELNRSKARFNIVVMHYPPVFSFPYDYDTTTMVNCNGLQYQIRLKVDTLTKKLRDLPLRKWNTQLCIAGHTHCGEHLIYDSLSYYTQLSGGASLGNYFSNRSPYSKFHYKAKHGFTIAEVKKDSIVMQLVNIDRDTVYAFNVYPSKSLRIKAKTKTGADTLQVIIRETEMPYVGKDTCTRFVNESGVFDFPNAELNKSYFVEIRHRNSMVVYSRFPIQLGAVIKEVDMTDRRNVAGDNIDVDGTMYSGNVNQDDIVDGTDLRIIDDAVLEYKTGYSVEDLNGSNLVDSEDIGLAEKNALKYVVRIFP